MIPNYINKWLKIIDEMQNDNTYKLAFGRALIENIVFSEYENVGNKIVIDFDDIHSNYSTFEIFNNSF